MAARDPVRPGDGAAALTGLPCVNGVHEAMFDDTAEAFAAMARAVDAAQRQVHVEFYIVAWDEVTAPLLESLIAARRRGVEVRLLMDHLGSRGFQGFKDLKRRLTEGDVDWHLMMPIQPLRGNWRRPDLRNHRKLLLADGSTAFIGSHNLIGPAYGSARNAAAGRLWTDLTMQFSGPAVVGVEAVFATDWFAETGERLLHDVRAKYEPTPPLGGARNAMQVIPSGPGFPTEPNARLFTALVHSAVRRVSITSPYFVPDDALLTAITSAAHRGVQVDLFVGVEADQFLVGHAQRSYYAALLDAGVLIHLYPAPGVLHAKYLTVDDVVGVLGSSNMDYRSYALNYEVMLLGFAGDLVDRLHEQDALYRSRSRVLTAEEWRGQRWTARYVDNVCRLTSALM